MFRKNKKGLSEIIGYVLLIVFAVSMSAIVYSFLRTKIPKQQEKCPADVSVEIISYNLESGLLNLTIDLRNRGLFSINGISVRLKEGGKSCSVIKASCKNCSRYQARSDKILFSAKMDPSEIKTISMIYAGCVKPSEIEIAPMRFMEEGFSICESSIMKETLED